MSHVLGLRKRHLGLALLGVAAVVSAVVMISAAPRADAARTVYFPNKCTNAKVEPTLIVVTCADGRTTFRTAGWQRWGSGSAHARGTLSFPECGNKPLFECDNLVNHEAMITLSAPQRCGGRWQFRRLFIEDFEPSIPSVRQIKESYPC